LRRADAERNIAAIVDTGLELFSRNGSASMTDVARAAGIGRVTLYAHFPSRTELIKALLQRAIEQADEALDIDIPPGERADQTLARLLRGGWPTLERDRQLRANIAGVISPQWLRAHHDRALIRLETLITQGQLDGVFRTDLSAPWMLTVIYSLLHAAAQEVDAGRLSAADVPGLLAATLLPAFAR
jgi:AcrR family transcriptional regulator